MKNFGMPTMAIEGAPVINIGGAVSTGPEAGDYHILVTDAALGKSKSERPNLQLELTVKDDPNHAAKEGKKLTKMFQSLPQDSDDEDKRKVMQGMLKRLVYDGFGVKWPTEPKALDPRIFVGKKAWIRLAKKKNEQTGEDRSEVVAVALTQDKLPASKGAQTGPVDGKAAGSRRR